MLRSMRRAESRGGAGQGAVSAPKRGTYPGYPRIWDVQQSVVEQAMLNQSGVSQATRGLREKAMAQAKGTACAKAQG